MHACMNDQMQFAVCIGISVMLRHMRLNCTLILFRINHFNIPSAPLNTVITV